MSRGIHIVVALALVILAGCSGTVREREAQSLATYLEYAQPPVEQFRFWRLQSWELVDDDKVVVWPNRSEAYLLTVDQPCDALRWARAIGVSSTGHTVQRRMDTVNAGTQKCHIIKIQPIDYRSMRRDRMARPQA